MATEVVEKHQLAGMDERERGFNRPVEIERLDEGYRASLRYETTIIVTDPCATQAAALGEVIRSLHGRGYTQLRSQLSFTDGAYRGNQEPWIGHPDPEQPPVPRAEPFGWLLHRWMPFKKRIGARRTDNAD
ncbi:MAG: hypothetical protein EPO64_09510 [Nitrospirae bacterium]|nr:MAG: hypothetical protein EPO64_09510 [Nitrospirota bacterium]